VPLLVFDSFLLCVYFKRVSRAIVCRSGVTALPRVSVKAIKVAFFLGTENREGEGIPQLEHFELAGGGCRSELEDLTGGELEAAAVPVNSVGLVRDASWKAVAEGEDGRASGAPVATDKGADPDNISIDEVVASERPGAAAAVGVREV
jgi:hypothetical protein